MQPQRLLSSRLSLGSFQGSASSSRCVNDLTCFFISSPLNIRLYSSKDHQSASSNGQTNSEAGRWPRSNRKVDISTLRSTQQIRLEPRQNPAQGPESPSHNPKDVCSDTKSMAIQQFSRQAIWRVIWPSKEIDGAQEEKMESELRPVRENRLAENTDPVEASTVPMQEIKRPGKRQRTKRAKTYVWQQLNMAEQQAGLVEVQINAFRNRILVSECLRVIERQLDRVERRMEILSKLDAVAQFSKIRDLELESIGKLLPILEQLYLSEKSLIVIREELREIQRRTRAWAQVMKIEQQLELVSSQTKSVRWQLEMLKRLPDISTIPGNATRRRPRASIPTPSDFLIRWLETSNISERELYWSKYKGCHGPLSLPLLLVAYLRISINPNVQRDEFDQSIVHDSLAVLQRNGFTIDDLAEWAWIVSAQETKLMTQRFISTPSKKPNFLLLKLLRRNDLDVRSLKLLLIYSWDCLHDLPRTNLTTISDDEIDSMIPCSSLSPLSNNISIRFTQESFCGVFYRLLYQARRIWPAAIVSISYMVEPFIHIHLGSGLGKSRNIKNKRHALLSRLYNRFLGALSLPSSINPLKSMVYNWQAQRVLLEMSTHFEPNLLLDQNGYRAVARVLAASKRSERESRAATLRTRSWPPWRVEQDGMDAQRLPEDDLSRVVVTANQAKASGYSEGVEDRFIKIIGGQEPDGTPTIPTRTLTSLRRLRSKCANARVFYAGCAPRLVHDPEARVWAARIESTRDVQEAWAAFVSYQERGLQPSMPIFFAMFTKLLYEAKRSRENFPPVVVPGEGKEVFPPSNDNYSSFYQSRLQPPSIDELYVMMRRASIRPTGRLLTCLVEHARDPFEVIRYLIDSGLNRQAVEFLKGQYPENPVVLKSIGEETFAAFISLLCRLAPRMAPTTVDSIIHKEVGNAENDMAGRSQGPNAWKLLKLREQDSNNVFSNPFLHCARLLKISRCRFRPAWYALFRGLVRRGVVMDHSFIDDPNNDIVAWNVLVGALGDFHNCGLELDPHGFRLICIGLGKALRASYQISKKEGEVLGKDQVSIVVKEFLKLSEVHEIGHSSIPTFLHPIEGAHLHEYIRILGLSEDHDGIMYALRWMARNHVELNNIALQSRNGRVLMQRTVIAVKVFLSGTEHESEAKEIVNGVDTWDGWPNALSAHVYLEHFSGCSNSNE